LRYHRTFGLDAEQLDELEARIEDILPDPWDKETGRPKSLSLREAIILMITLRPRGTSPRLNLITTPIVRGARYLGTDTVMSG